MEIDGFVLAGGPSSRMGTPKAHALIGDASMVDRAVSALQGICRSVRIAGELHGAMGREFVPDDPVYINGERTFASIVGLRTAMVTAQTDWVAVLACDLPFVTGAVFETMLERLTNAGPERYDVVLIEQTEGRLQPLVGIYRRQTALPVVAAAIQVEAFSLRLVLSELRVLTVPATVFGPNSDVTFMNVNNATDLDQARSAFGSE